MSRLSTVAILISEAREQTGYRSLPHRNTTYGNQTGKNGAPWSGSLLEVIFRKTKIFPGVSLVSTTAALSYFNRINRLYRKPRPGDIVFFATSSNPGALEQPQAGLVTEVNRDTFKAIAGETASPATRGHRERDGVYEHTYRTVDTLAFARPRYQILKSDPCKEPPASSRALPAVRESQFLHTKFVKSTVQFQLALSATVSAEGMTRGIFDSATRIAVQRYQRERGFPDGSGIPDDRTIRALAAETEYQFFTV